MQKCLRAAFQENQMLRKQVRDSAIVIFPFSVDVNRVT